MAEERVKKVHALVARFEQWSKDSSVKPEDDELWEEASLSSQDEAEIEQLTDPKEKLLLREKKRQEQVRKKIEERKSATKTVRPKGQPKNLAEWEDKVSRPIEQPLSRAAATPRKTATLPQDSKPDADAVEGKSEVKPPGEDNITAEWDEETQTFWYTDKETGIQYYWNEETQKYEADQDGGSAGKEIEIPEPPTDNAEAEPIVSTLSEVPAAGLDEDLKRTDLEKLKKMAELIGVDVETLQRLENGHAAYAYVKANNGMLKPLKLFYRPMKGKLYIVRNSRSQYLHLTHFGEISINSQELEELTTDVITGISPLVGQPHIIFYTNETYHQETKPKSKFHMPRALKKALLKEKPHKKSLLFIFEEFDERNELFDVLKRTHEKFNSTLTFRD